MLIRRQVLVLPDLEKQVLKMRWRAETHISKETYFVTTPACSIQWMPIHSLSFYVGLCHSSSSHSLLPLFLLRCRVSTVIPVVPPLPGDSDQGEQYLLQTGAICLCWASWAGERSCERKVVHQLLQSHKLKQKDVHCQSRCWMPDFYV